MTTYAPRMCIHGANEYTCRKCDAEWQAWLDSQSRLCPGCKYEIDGCAWGPDSLCRDCYEDRIPSPYCKHGTYIGGPSGPDYLCGYCEIGD